MTLFLYEHEVWWSQQKGQSIVVAADQLDPSEEDQWRARRRAFAEIAQGNRSMEWSDWAIVIHESKRLTSEGRRVAFWAQDTLQHALKDDFLAKVNNWLADKRAHGDPSLGPQSHPIFSLGLWPVNDVPLVYANLIRLAAQIQLLLPDEKNRHKGVLKDLRKKLGPENWLSTLVQFEVATLGLQAGWKILLEPAMGKRKADVRLTRDTTVLFVEVTTKHMANAERRINTFYDRLWMHLYLLGSEYEVRISGRVSHVALQPDDVRARWLQEVEDAAQRTSKDGQDRVVPGSEGVSVTVFRPTEATAFEPWGIDGEPTEVHVLDRLRHVLQEKNEQAEQSPVPVWVRVDEFAGIWGYVREQRWSLAQTLTVFTDFLQDELVFYPKLAGVMLSPGLLLTDGTPLDALVEQADYRGALAFRRPVPVQYVREMLIIPQAGLAEAEAEVPIFADLYQHETTWLDWAMKNLGLPPFNELMRE